MIIFDLIMIGMAAFGALMFWIVVGCLISSYFTRRACEKSCTDKFCDVMIEKVDKIEIQLNKMEEKIDEKIEQEENDECSK